MAPSIFFIRDFPIAAMLNPSRKSRFLEEFRKFCRIKKFSLENKKRSKIKNVFFIKIIKNVKNVLHLWNKSTLVSKLFFLAVQGSGALLSSNLEGALYKSP